MPSGDHGWEYTVEEYVRIQDEDPLHKYEWEDGQIRLMSGGTLEHARLAVEVAYQIKRQLRGRPCVVFSSDARVRVPPKGLITYPDLSVVCAPSTVDLEDVHAQTNPLVLVEITSKSSERYDRGRKRMLYQRIAALREIVIVSHREPAIDVYRRLDASTWSQAERSLARQKARLESLDVEIDVDELYTDPRNKQPS